MRNRIKEPAALQQQILIVSCPPPALAIMPTSYIPAVEGILGDLFFEVCVPVYQCCKDVKRLFSAFLKVTKGECRNEPLVDTGMAWTWQLKWVLANANLYSDVS
jgi:hypothetical protein